MLRNFMHATAVIMAGSGMKEVLASSVGSVDKMLSGKKYPQMFYALRMLVEELLHRVLQIQVLDAHYSGSRTTKLWIDNLVDRHHNDELLSCWT